MSTVRARSTGTSFGRSGRRLITTAAATAGSAALFSEPHRDRFPRQLDAGRGGGETRTPAGRPALLDIGSKEVRRQPRPGLGDPNPGVLAIHYPNSADAIAKRRTSVFTYDLDGAAPHRR